MKGWELEIESRPARNRRVMFAIVALAAAIGFAVLAISMSESGDAAFPGTNGRIAYSSGDSYSYSSAAIWSANADGGSPALLAAGSGVSAPSYSADGSRIAFDKDGGVAVMSATGAGLVQLTDRKRLAVSAHQVGDRTTSIPTRAKPSRSSGSNPSSTSGVTSIIPRFPPMARGWSSAKRAAGAPTAASAPSKPPVSSNASPFPTQTRTSITNTAVTPAVRTWSRSTRRRAHRSKR